MFGYEFIARKIDQKIDIEWGGQPGGKWTTEDVIRYDSFRIASWDTGGYPEWPQNLVDQGISTVEHDDILISKFRFPLKYLIQYLTDGGKESKPNILQEDGTFTWWAKLGGLKIYNEELLKGDPEEIIQVTRMDMS
jgi:hypothetical protein